jgi:lipopolysaccharide export system permease protein
VFRILQRMILGELVKVFLIALVGITGILLMAGIIAEASQQGLAPGQVLAAIPLLIPSTLPYTIPATTLFAACVVYGRLAADNELLAIKSAGVNALVVVRPGLLLGLALTAGTLGLYYEIIPNTHRLLRALIFHDARELIYTVLKKNRAINHGDLPYAMFVRGVRGDKLVDPVIKRKGQGGKVDMVAEARDADLRVDLPRSQICVTMKNCTAAWADGSRAFFEERTWEVPLPGDFGAESQRRPRDMTWPEIGARRAEVEDELDALGRHMWACAGQMMGDFRAEDVPQHFKSLEERVDFQRKQLLALDVERLMRPALSLGCLCFILVGCPVGIWLCRGDYLGSFIVCFLPIVVVYYPLLLCGTGMAKEGRLPPAPLVYAADALVGLLGLALFARLRKN